MVRGLDQGGGLDGPAISGDDVPGIAYVLAIDFARSRVIGEVVQGSSVVGYLGRTVIPLYGAQLVGGDTIPCGWVTLSQKRRPELSTLIGATAGPGLRPW